MRSNKNLNFRLIPALNFGARVLNSKVNRVNEPRINAGLVSVVVAAVGSTASSTISLSFIVVVYLFIQ